MRYLIALLITIAVIIFVIIRLLTGGGGGDKAITTPRALASYADTNTTVRYVIDNPVQANVNHRDIIITVGRAAATLVITQGYEGDVISSQTFANNTNAYSNFLLALDHTAGFTQGDNAKALRDDRGYCGSGNRYSYDIINPEGSRIQHFWSTSCKEATYKGDVDATAQLFKAQIPNFDDLTKDVDY